MLVVHVYVRIIVSERKRERKSEIEEEKKAQVKISKSQIPIHATGYTITLHVPKTNAVLIMPNERVSLLLLLCVVPKGIYTINNPSELL